MNKRIIFIIAGVVAAVAVAIVAIGLITQKPDETEATGPAANVDTALTDGEKSAIEATTKKFVSDMGNYGWYPELIKNPDNSGGPLTDEFFYSQEYTTQDDLKTSMRVLTNSMDYDSAINGSAYNAPFSVETALAGDVSIPDKPIAIGNNTLVEVTVPLASTLSYVSSTMSYMGDDGNFVDAKTVVSTKTFEGELTIRFDKSAGQWYVFEFEDTLGVLATDEWFVVNGDLILPDGVAATTEESYEAGS